MVLPKVNKKILLELLILLILLGLIVLIVLKYYHAYRRKYQNQTASEEPTAQTELYSKIPSSPPPPSPLLSPKPIPHGKIGFSVSQADKTKPQFSQGEIDPYDPPKGGRQSVTISVRDEQPVSQVSAVLKTDNAVSQPVSFKLISGSDTDGTWQGSWTLTDTYLYTYNLVLTAVSSRGQASVEITLR